MSDIAQAAARSQPSQEVDVDDVVAVCLLINCTDTLGLSQVFPDSLQQPAVNREQETEVSLMNCHHFPVP